MTQNTQTQQPKIQHPATKAFVSAIIAECDKQGLAVLSLDPSTESGLRENGGWCFLRLEGTHEQGASLIVPKAAARLGRLHSHIDLSGHDGYVALPKKNGKVICHFEPDVSKVAAVLKLFLSASKRATAAATPKATPSVPVTATPVAPVADLMPSVEEWEALVAAEEAMEEAELQTQSTGA